MDQEHPITLRPPASDGELNVAAALMAGTDPWITLGIRAGQILQDLRDPMYETWLAVSGGEIAGVAVLQLKGACTGYLKSLAVKKTWRGRRVGTLLMDHIEQRIFTTLPNVFLCVSSFNERARRFYLKRGYHEIGTLRDYLVKGYDEILMRKSTGPLL